MAIRIGDTQDTSVTFSLAELARIEDERVRAEEAQRARAHEDRKREQRQAEERRREAEIARIAADVDARARREREEAEEKARSEARRQAALEVARIEAEAKVRLEADNALRAQELAILRARTEGGRRRLQHGLVAALVLVLVGGSVAACAASRQTSRMEREAEQLREQNASLLRAREHAMAAERAALDRHHAVLRARFVRGADEASVAAEAARNAVDRRGADEDSLLAYDIALEGLSARLGTLEQLALLDRRHADLAAWAAKQRRSDVDAATRNAAGEAHGAGSDQAALRAYERALDKLRDALLAGGSPAASRREPPKMPGDSPGICENGDPLCGLERRP